MFMKIIAILISTLVIVSSVLSQQNVTITGKITNPTGDKVYLFKPIVVDNKYERDFIDSTKIAGDGSFELKGYVSEAGDAIFYDGNEQFNMLLSPNDNMHLTLNTLYFDETLLFSGKGSKANNALVNLYLIEEMHSNELQTLATEEELDTVAIFELQDKNNASYIELINDYKNEIPNLEERAKMLTASSERSSESLKNYLRSKIDFQKKMKPLLNKTAIDFEGIDLEGEKVSLSDFKGKVTVVDFWATWCGPCKAEFPAYKELEDKYGDDVNFVSVGVYCKEDEWKEMAKNEGFKHNIYISKEEQDQISKYEVRTIPRYLVIDENFNLIDADAPRPSSGKLESYWK